MPTPAPSGSGARSRDLNRLARVVQRGWHVTPELGGVGAHLVRPA
jgi:hypothetical protein